MIGDSTMGQTATVLMNAVHHHCPGQMHFVASDTLIGVRFGHMNRGMKWIKAVRLYDPDIVLMSAGPHIRRQQDYQIMLETVYAQLIKEHNKSMRDKLLIWKTISPGGIASLGIVDEIPNLDDNETMAMWIEQGYQPAWRWDLFPKYDRMAKEYFRSKGIAVLDVEPLYYRLDNHPGTNIHHCAHGDGALRLIPRLLQKLMEELNEANNHEDHS